MSRWGRVNWTLMIVKGIPVTCLAMLAASCSPSDSGTPNTPPDIADAGPKDGAAKDGDAAAAETGNHDAGRHNAANDAEDASFDVGAPKDASDVGDAPTGLEQTEPYRPWSSLRRTPTRRPRRSSVKFSFGTSSWGARTTWLVAPATEPKRENSDPSCEPGRLRWVRGRIRSLVHADDARGGRGIARCDEHGVPKDNPVFHFANQVTSRKPPTYLDAWFFTELFWDGRATSKFTLPGTTTVAIVAGGALESQAANPPVAATEMACEARTWDDIAKKLETVVPLALATQIPVDMQNAIASHPSYPLLFEAAYGSKKVDTKGILFAIATHERRLTSKKTPWDRYNGGELTALSAAQSEGSLSSTPRHCATSATRRRCSRTTSSTTSGSPIRRSTKGARS